MFDWLLRVFRRPEEDERQNFFKDIDQLNAKSGGGKPVMSEQYLGSLKVRSGILTLGDPQYMPGLKIPGIVCDEAAISASLWRYPSGSTTITALTLRLGEAPSNGTRRKVGTLGIDSATVVVADLADYEEHSTETGKSRRGMILTARNDVVLQKLTRRFKLQTTRENPVRAEVVGPVSEQLEQEIEDYLKADPEYAHFPPLYFYVQTDNSFDRANYLPTAWGFVPVGNAEKPLMFVCRTGRGDGEYEVQCTFENETPRVLHVTFIED